jgi:soluble lytic murein transglycosylase-like protein
MIVDSRTGRALVALAALSTLVTGSPGIAGDEPLFYEVRDGAVVFTNTPTAATRPVPGWKTADPRNTPTGGSGIPATIYDPFIDRVARENGLSPGLIKAVALVESGFDPHAVSPKGAQGLMQLMPGTARQYGVQDAFDPLQNLRAGAIHLRRLLDQFDGDLTLALAAYNAGAGTVERHGGVPDYKETQDYLRRVKSNMGLAAPVRPARPAASRETSYRDVKLLRQADGSVLLVN